MIRMEVRRDEWLGPDKHRVGLSFKTRITKNKTAPPQRSAAMDFYWEDTEGHKAGSYDIGKQVANIALDLEVVQQNVSMYRYDGRSWRGKEALFRAIEEDEVLRRDLERAVRHAAAGVIGVESTDIDKPKRRLRKVS